MLYIGSIMDSGHGTLLVHEFQLTDSSGVPKLVRRIGFGDCVNSGWLEGLDAAQSAVFASNGFVDFDLGLVRLAKRVLVVLEYFGVVAGVESLVLVGVAFVDLEVFEKGCGRFGLSSLEG